MRELKVPFSSLTSCNDHFSAMYAYFSSQSFESNLVWMMEKEGWNGSEGEDDIQWTFAGALFYSIVVITTIGTFPSFIYNIIRYDVSLFVFGILIFLS